MTILNLEAAERLRFSDPERALELAVDVAREGVPRGMVLATMILVDEPETRGLLEDAHQWLAAAARADEWVPPWLAESLSRRRRQEGLHERELIDAVLHELGLKAWREAIMAAALPSTRLVARRARNELAVGVAKLGGEPDLADDGWPEADGHALAFVAQLEWEGMLLGFFFDAEHQPWGWQSGVAPGWCITVTPRDAARRCSTPDGVRCFDVCALEARHETTFPPVRSREARELVAATDGLDLDAYSNLAMLWPARRPVSDGRIHRTGGHPDAIQGDMTGRIEAALRGEDPDAASPALEAAAPAWRLLLQVDSEAQSSMRWGGDGRLFFWIREADLTAGRFTDVQVQLQTG